MTLKAQLFSAIIAICLFFMPVVSQPVDLNTLPANSWYAVPNSKMRPVCATTASSYGCWCVMVAWNGGAYNQNLHELVVFGGGHNDYNGNELYAFNIDSLTWRRVTNPSYPSNRCNEVNSDNTPVSRHSYSGLAYITHASRFFALGGALDCGAGGCGANETWTFDFGPKTWHRMLPTGNQPSTGCEDVCAYDPQSRMVFYHTNSGLHAYNFESNQWSLKNSDNDAYSRTMTVDTKRNLLVEVGQGKVTTFDLGTSGLTKQTLTTTGDNSIVTQNAIGLAYDPNADKVVAYDEGKVYVLDMDTRQWTVKTPSGTGPRNTTFNGTFGRWRYVPHVNAFILAVDVDSSIYFYKHTAGAGTSVAPQASPAPAINSSLSIANQYHGIPVDVSIFSLTGDRVKRMSISGKFSSGIYVMRITQGAKLLAQKRTLVR